MIEEIIVKLFKEKGFGTVIFPIDSVSGGFLHRMYRVNTQYGRFAVKHLNPNIMKRPGAIDNFKCAEALEIILDAAGIPIVPAIMISGSKMQEYAGEFFYIFRWQKGQIGDWYGITAGQCRLAGSILGRIHAIAPQKAGTADTKSSSVDLSAYGEYALEKNADIGRLLKENRELMIYAWNELNHARAALPGVECIVNEDMDPKNVMWDDGMPYVIDLECLERGNPVSNVLQLSLQWSGVTICALDFDKMKAFFDGYLDAYDNGFRDYSAVFGLAYAWIEWLEYNVERALGHCEDEKEREIGISEVKNTVARIRYIREMEDQIVYHLNCWFK